MTNISQHAGFFLVALVGFVLVAFPSSLDILGDVGRGFNGAMSDFFRMMLGQF